MHSCRAQRHVTHVCRDYVPNFEEIWVRERPWPDVPAAKGTGRRDGHFVAVSDSGDPGKQRCVPLARIMRSLGTHGGAVGCRGMQRRATATYAGMRASVAKSSRLSHSSYRDAERSPPVRHMLATVPFESEVLSQGLPSEWMA